MRVDLFDFDLPEANIALRPARPRDAARMMVVESGRPSQHLWVRDLPGSLRAGDLLVINNTKVLPAVLRGQRRRGDHLATVSLTLFERVDAESWRALAKPAKRLAVGDIVAFGDISGLALEAVVTDGPTNGEISVRFKVSDNLLDAALARLGHMPLPAYIASRRAEDNSDQTDYQTVYAERDGAIAAPTAGLHFTTELLDTLESKGVRTARVTLHVGPGTFLPVKAETTDGHVMHSEWGEISEDAAETINSVRRDGGRIVSVGTTSLRLLESAAEPDGIVRPFVGETDIFITPGYRFRAVDVLMTNFHLPRSTLFMLVSAFAGRERMLAAYKEAIAAGYRFYSYGDACLLFPEAA